MAITRQKIYSVLRKAGFKAAKWIGFIISILALLMVGRFPPVVSLAIGVLGVAISIGALVTAK